ncbi:MAG: hypothetical protein RLZZ272_582 [Actinomycetota bacterium]
MSKAGAAALAALVVMLAGACAAPTPDAPAPIADGPGADVSQPPDVSMLLDPERGDPPVELVLADVVEGEGAPAAPGDGLVVHYVGLRWSDGGRFDASWDRGTPFALELGAGSVIPGWEQGLEGMREGGRRVLTIPPDLAYGDRGAGDVIGPGETLVFVVDLIAREPAP